MDLKIADVAKLLSVSEGTVQEWIVEKKIPTYSLGEEYRFCRTEIEKWLLNHNSGSSDGSPLDLAKFSGGSRQFSLFRAIHKGDVLHNVPGKTKEEVISTTVRSVAPKMQVDADVMIDMLLDREKLMSTALSNGIAVPHSRDSLSHAMQDAIYVVFPEQPLQYGALDDQPVHTLFFLFACEDRQHLHLLAKIAHFARHPAYLDFLLTKPSKEKLLSFMKEWEGRLVQKNID